MKRSTSPRVVANWYRPRTSATPANTGSRPRGTVWTSSPISSLIGALCASVTGLGPGVAAAEPDRRRVHGVLGAVVDHDMQPLALPLDPRQHEWRVVHPDRNADPRLNEVSLRVFLQVPPQVGENPRMRHLNALIVPVAI